jgi:hypothetical protein
MKKLMFVLPLVIAAIALPVASSGASSHSSPVVLTFTKHAVGPDLYLGTIDGGGTIEVMVLDRRNTETEQHFSAMFRVNVGEQWFAGVLRGTFDFATLQTHLRGRATYGNWLEGATIREEGQLIDDDPLTFTGSLTLTQGND